LPITQRISQAVILPLRFLASKFGKTNHSLGF
jgi:hypothetical protein